jgi:hypothetical protein
LIIQSEKGKLKTGRCIIPGGEEKGIMKNEGGAPGPLAPARGRRRQEDSGEGGGFRGTIIFAGPPGLTFSIPRPLAWMLTSHFLPDHQQEIIELLNIICGKISIRKSLREKL